jgi:hypothetical protein
MTLPSPSRRTLRALGFITVWPIETWPSPAMMTLPFLRTERMVVPCQTGMEWSFPFMGAIWERVCRPAISGSG